MLDWKKPFFYIRAFLRGGIKASTKNDFCFQHVRIEAQNFTKGLKDFLNLMHMKGKIFGEDNNTINKENVVHLAFFVPNPVVLPAT